MSDNLTKKKLRRDKEIQALLKGNFELTSAEYLSLLKLAQKNYAAKLNLLAYEDDTELGGFAREYSFVLDKLHWLIENVEKSQPKSASDVGIDFQLPEYDDAARLN